MDRFWEEGHTKFFISTNYKSKMIEDYFETNVKTGFNISFFSEDRPLGTAGSLSLVKDRISTDFFVSNCDIIVESDYSEIYSFHKENKYELTAVAFVKELTIPYGTFELESEGLLSTIKEKPKYTFLVNAGLYVLSPHVLDEIPKDRMFHITDLMNKIISRGGRVGVFPINEGSWLDIGQWKEYNRTLKRYDQEINL